MMHPTSPRPDAGLCYCCGQTFTEQTRVLPEIGQRWTGALERHTARGVCPLCYNTYGVLHGHAVPWSDDRWLAHHRAVIAQQHSPRALRQIADSIVGQWPELAALARDRAENLERRRVTLDTLDLAARIKAETDAEELLWLAEALDSRSPELARLARRRAAPHHGEAPWRPVDDAQPERDTPEPSNQGDDPAPKRRTWRTGALFAVALTLLVGAVSADLTQMVLTSLQSCRASAVASPPPALSGATTDALPPGHPPIANALTPCPSAMAELPPGHPPISGLAATSNHAVDLPDVPPRRLEEPGRFVERGGVRTLLTQGYDALHATELDRAMGYFDQALKLNPRSSEAYMGQGHVHLAKGHMPWAIGAFETAHQLDPTHPEGLMTLATTYERLGDRESALRCVERLLTIYPDHQPGRAWRDQLKASLRWEMPSLERVRAE